MPPPYSRTTACLSANPLSTTDLTLFPMEALGHCQPHPGPSLERMPAIIFTRGGNPMGNLSGVVQQLKKERTRLADELHRVTAALTAFGKVYISGSNPKAVAANRTKRTISVAGRKRIAAAQRARWAKQKQSEKPKRRISAAGRRTIAAAQRAR
jgi:hypothetical protein